MTWENKVHLAHFCACYFVVEEAEQKYGVEKIKNYRSTFVPMYYAMTENKVKCSMKLVCLLPEEKVCFYKILSCTDVCSYIKYSIEMMEFLPEGRDCF